MEEYFARQRRRRLIAIAVGLVVAIVAFVVVKIPAVAVYA